jgi:hypothetical protein
MNMDRDHHLHLCNRVNPVGSSCRVSRKGANSKGSKQLSHSRNFPTMGDQGSAYEWRRKRDRVDKALEIAEHSPQTLFARRGLVTIPQKRKVYEQGIKGQAEILEAPGKHSRSDIDENVGRFRVRVELPDRPPYEVKMTQSYSFGFEAEALSQGAVVECRVDPKNEKRVLLVAPEPDHPIDLEVRSLEAPQQASAAATVAAGKPAIGTVKSAELSEIPSPAGSDGRIWQITMELQLRARVQGVGGDDLPARPDRRGGVALPRLRAQGRLRQAEVRSRRGDRLAGLKRRAVFLSAGGTRLHSRLERV